MKKLITLSLYADELYYDVESRAWLTGRSRETEGNYREVSHLQSAADSEGHAQIARMVRAAADELRTALSEWMAESVPEADNRLPAHPQGRCRPHILLVLLLPGNFNESATATLASAAHRYIVCRVLADWFLITDKADAADYAAIAAEQLGILREALHRRVRPMRPTPGAETDRDTEKGGNTP